MLKTALLDSLRKDVWVNSRKNSVRWGRFRFVVNIRFCDGHQFCCFFIIYVIIQYQICSNHIYFISIGILIHENNGLDTKITLLLQLEQKLWHIYRNKVWNGGHLGFFSCFSSLYTHNNGLPCCIMCLSDFLTKKIAHGLLCPCYRSRFYPNQSGSARPNRVMSMKNVSNLRSSNLFMAWNYPRCHFKPVCDRQSVYRQTDWDRLSRIVSWPQLVSVVETLRNS